MSGSILAQKLGDLIGARRSTVGRGGEGRSRKPAIYADEKSDTSSSTEKLPNKGEVPGGGGGGKGRSQRKC